MKEFDLDVLRFCNSRRMRKRLTAQFGGLTFLSQKSKGVLKWHTFFIRAKSSSSEPNPD
jgi:hypothetical protein